MTLQLWNTDASPFAVKVRIALREKSLPFEKLDPGKGFIIGSPSPAFSSSNPHTQVPTLIHNGNSIYGSDVILEYLDEAFPKTQRLLPTDAASRAKARIIQQVIDGPLEAVNFTLMEVKALRKVEGEVASTIIANAEKQTRALTAWIESQLSPQSTWLSGDSFGFIDVALLPFLHRCDLNGFGPPEGTILHAWLPRARERASVKETLAEATKALEGFRAMATNNPFAPGTGGKRQFRDHRLHFMVKAGGLSVVEEGLRDGTIRLGWPEL